MPDIRNPCTTETGHDQAHISRGPTSGISGSHSILVAKGEHLAAMVIRAARLAAILLHIARGLRHADKDPPRLRDWKHAAQASVAPAKPLPCVLAPAGRPCRSFPRPFPIPLFFPHFPS